MTILGFPVTGSVETESGQVYPMVDIPMMSDQTWQRLATENAVHNYIKTFGYAPENEDTACIWQRLKCAQIVEIEMTLAK